MVQVEVRGQSYYLNKKMKSKWDNLKDGKLTKIDEDRVYIVDGKERSGKSLWTLQQAAYIDPTILDDVDGKVLPRITFSAEETLEAIRTTKSSDTQTKVIIHDEAFRGMSSRGSLSKENRMLAQAVQEMGQNNIVLFIVAPRFFMLESYIALSRAYALFHIIKDKKSKKRLFKMYNEKKKSLLYTAGMKKGWAYNVKTKFKDWFFGDYPGGKEFELRYRKKKAMSLSQMGEEPKKANESRNEDRNKLIRIIYAQNKNIAETYRIIKAGGIDLSYQMTALIVGKTSEKEA